MRIGVLGINHKLADLKLREQLAIACQRRFHAFSPLKLDHPFILLSTCNRTELYFCGEDLATTHTLFLQELKEEVPGDFEQKLYSFFGQDCFFHLAKVAAGLDSAIFGETEIQGQVKHAYEGATKHTKLPYPLHFLFQKSLKIAKNLRTAYLFDRTTQALEQAVYQTGMSRFPEHTSPSILIVGASSINQNVLSHLKRKGCKNITLCNRTSAKAEQLSRQFQVPLHSWDKLDQWHSFDWIILGTKAPDYLIRKECLNAPFRNEKLLIDLGLPRNADPQIAQDSRIHLFNIDQINTIVRSGQKQLNDEKIHAESTILEAVAKHTSLFQIKTNFNPLLKII